MKSIAFSLLFLTSVGSAIAQPFADAEYLSSTPFILNGAALIDLEGDGDLDAFSSGTAFNGSGIEVWVNNNGVFELDSQTIPFSESGANIFGVADIDMDGDDDFATVIKNRLVWFPNDGTGNFGNPTLIDSEMGDIRNIEFENLDGISGDEMIVTLRTNDQVGIYVNDGIGGFGPVNIVASQSVDPIDVLFDDLDGDGIKDMVVACLNSCDVTWYKGLGGLDFGPQQLLGGDQVGTYKLALADYDQNGHIDIAAIGFGSDDLSIFFNSGGGNFGGRTIISTTIDGPVDLAVGDFNNDGNQDLCVGTQEELFATYFEGDGAGGFTQMSMAELGSVASSQVMLAGDVDNDGRIDLVTASSFDNKLALLKQHQFNVPSGSLPFEPQTLINKPASGISDMILIDMNEDGLDDILSTETKSGRVVQYTNLANGSFGQQKEIMNLGEGVSGLASDDLDGDGFYDIAVSSISDSSLVLFLNQGDGVTFIPTLVDQVLDEPYSPFLSDLDDDGDLDIILAVGWDAVIYIYPNNGNGTFAERITLCDNCLFSRLTSAQDLNDDGLPEVLVYKGSGQAIAMYENLGSMQFGESVNLIGSFNGARDVEYIDFDNDGDLDVFGTAIYDPRINYAENLGELNFAPASEIPINVSRSHDIEAIDVDMDGDLDIAYTGATNNTLSVIYMEDGEFLGKRTVDKIYYNPTNLLAGDFDEDGKPDLVTGFDNFVAFYSSQALTCAASRPINLANEITETTIDFSWSPIEGTQGCRLYLRDNTGDIQEQNILGEDLGGFSAPLGFFNAGSLYYWRVECACSINPLELTEASKWEGLFVPSNLPLEVFPNPAEEILVVQSNKSDLNNESYTIHDLLGRIMLQGKYTGSINLESLESGYYLITIGGDATKFLKN
ncbi:MAG: T9SS type A sorting domain-containing protein [Bacteroidota bacterium]